MVRQPQRLTQEVRDHIQFRSIRCPEHRHVDRRYSNYGQMSIAAYDTNISYR